MKIDKTKWPEEVHRFIDWVEGSEPPARILYLQADHASANKNVSGFMMRMAEEGRVCLTQRRIREGVFNYMATRVTKRTGEKLKPMDWTI